MDLALYVAVKLLNQALASINLVVCQSFPFKIRNNKQSTAVLLETLGREDAVTSFSRLGAEPCRAIVACPSPSSGKYLLAGVDTTFNLIKGANIRNYFCRPFPSFQQLIEHSQCQPCDANGVQHSSFFKCYRRSSCVYSLTSRCKAVGGMKCGVYRYISRQKQAVKCVASGPQTCWTLSPKP